MSEEKKDIKEKEAEKEIKEKELKENKSSEKEMDEASDDFSVSDFADDDIFASDDIKVGQKTEDEDLPEEIKQKYPNIHVYNIENSKPLENVQNELKEILKF